MPRRSYGRGPARWMAFAAGATFAAYLAYVATSWARYGQPATSADDEEDPLLDRFMPVYDVVDRQHRRMTAPAAAVLAASREMNLLDSPVARAIFKARELILSARPEDRRHGRGLLAEVQALGWAVLAEIPDREIVVGAVTQPWKANVIFRAVPAEKFAAFAEPDYVKIVWNLRADPIGPRTSIFRTETRAVGTDTAARAKFRAYWAFFSPGMKLIRWASLGPLANDAARRTSTEAPSVKAAYP